MEEVNSNIQIEKILSQSIAKLQNFWKALKLSVIKPHTIRRQLAGAEQIAIFKCTISEPIAYVEFCIQIASKISKPNRIFADCDFIPRICANLSVQTEVENIGAKYLHDTDINDDHSKHFIIILNKLLAKNLKVRQHSFELIIFDPANYCAAFLGLQNTESIDTSKKFIIEAKNRNNNAAELVVSVLKDGSESTDLLERDCKWIKHAFTSKVVRWIETMEDTEDSIIHQSISLLNLEEYNQLYNDLKVKYGEHMVKIWPEKTDPSKFVYEDVAIATYLLLLWRDERRQQNSTRLQSFVDLGCGNGLLVYILSSEGHPGYGIDLRKRGIWDLYPETTVLKTEAIVPSDQSLFPDIDWLIGNHSDELSPWIPVISARSSYQSRYFLLPCCAFEFNGKKYQRRYSTRSQYMDFIQHVNHISDVCGFHTKIDRLKIPSTKRICLIGSGRSYAADEQNDRCQSIQNFINQESGLTQENAPNETWNNEFKPRSDVEKVQNCTKVDKAIVKEIIGIVFSELIKTKKYLKDFVRHNWNCGTKIPLRDLIQLIPRDKLVALKSECGGLQTLLKNHSQIFRVIGGMVELRIPMNVSERKRELERLAETKSKPTKIHFKQTACWFHLNHPDGCPFDDADCTFKH